MVDRSELDDIERSQSFAVFSGLLVCVTIALVLTMPNCVYVGDAVAMRAGTVNLISTGEISVPHEYATRFGSRGQYFYENPSSGLWFSKYGMLNSLLYVPPLLAEWCASGQLQFFNPADGTAVGRRCFALNVYNVFISLCITLYLFITAKLYVRRAWQAALFVLAVLFGTFLWNYLRAQTVEIFQVLFFTAIYYHLVRYVRNGCGETNTGRRYVHLATVYTFLCLLCWSKLIFVLVVPFVALFVTLADFDRSKFNHLREFVVHAAREKKRALGATVLLPIGAICLIIGSANWYCFGSPVATGYEQWAWDGRFFTLDITDGALGFWIDPQKSIPLYFPLMAFAMLGLRGFWREHRFEYGFALSVFVVLYVANSAFSDWRGGWCFGPRYLLFALPVLSLPLLSLISSPCGKMYWRRVAMTGAVLVSLWFASKQLVVHSVEFFVPIRAERSFAHIDNPRVQDYFSKPFWIINRDLINWNSGKGSFPPLELISDRVSKSEYEGMAARMRRLTVNNLFWLEFARRRRVADVSYLDSRTN
jgi:hypothetical protein